MHRSYVSVAFVVVLAALVPTRANAQPRPLQQVLDLNRQAMDAYNNLEIEQAQSLLSQALDAATRGHVTGSPLARTYVNLGIVAIAGTGDNGAGLNYFIQALQADGSVALDPLLSTPDIQSIWTAAHSRVSTAPVVTDPTPPPSGGGPVGDLVHQPVPEQLRQTPVPVYVEVPGRPAHVYLYYRGHGMRDFERAEMDHVGRGFGYEIPCGDVFEPEVNYYIAVFDTSGSPISFAGSQSAPISVPIVATRSTSAPALPGRAPPTQCTSMEEECPPGMAGCHGAGAHGSRGLGDSCHSDADCSSGNCEDDLCALGDGGHDDGGGGGGGEPDNGAPRFFARISGGVGASYVGNGLSVDRNPCQDGDMSGGTNDCSTLNNPQPLPSGSATALGTYQHFTNNAHLYGYDDSAVTMAGPSTCSQASTRDPYCFYVDSPGMVANFALRLDIGYYIVPRWLALGVMARFQPISGNGTLSFMQLGARLELELTEPVPVGFHVNLFLGGGAGQVQVFLSRTNDTNQFAPWGSAGLGYVDFGSTLGYRFMRNFGIHLQPIFVFAFGSSFMFTLDVVAGFEVGF